MKQFFKKRVVNSRDVNILIAHDGNTAKLAFAIRHPEDKHDDAIVKSLLRNRIVKRKNLFLKEFIIDGNLIENKSVRAGIIDQFVVPDIANLIPGEQLVMA